MRKRRSSQRVDLEIARILVEIEQHPFSSARRVEAESVVAEAPDLSQPQTDKRLSDRGLPTVPELGAETVRHLWSWGRLHRRLRKLKDQGA